MALLNKSDLKYTYSWTAIGGDDPKITGTPDSTLFNRREGYEVLYMINKFAVDHKLKNKPTGHKIEKMVNDHLPSNIRSQDNVVTWIVDNWKKH